MKALTRLVVAAGIAAGSFAYKGVSRELVIRGELGDSFLRKGNELGAEAITHDDLIDPLSLYSADRVIAIPLERGVKELISARINHSGRFELRLPREGSWALMLVDHQSEVVRTHFQGVVAMRTTGGRRLSFKPSDYFGRINLGELRADEGFALSEFELEGGEAVRGPAISTLMQDQEEFIFHVRTIYWELMGDSLHVKADEPNPFSVAASK